MIQLQNVHCRARGRSALLDIQWAHLSTTFNVPSSSRCSFGKSTNLSISRSSFSSAPCLCTHKQSARSPRRPRFHQCSTRIHFPLGSRQDNRRQGAGMRGGLVRCSMQLNCLQNPSDTSHINSRDTVSTDTICIIPRKYICARITVEEIEPYGDGKHTSLFRSQ